MKRLVLIDGKSVFYRGYYAMGALSLPDGTPTGGVYGFAAIAMEIVKKLNPTKVVVAWDSKSSVSKRRAIYKDYKAGRIKPGDDFYAQIPLLEELVHGLGWQFVEIDDYEADDIIGTLSREADETLDEKGKCDYETFIISSDLDMLQIVDENTHMWRILKGFTNIEQIDIAEIEGRYGIKQSQFLDFKALKGDNSDNIPGVPGIGEKTAAKLLNEYGDLDGIYNNIDNIAGSTKDKLVAGKESAYMSKTLAQIMFDAPVDLSTIPDFHLDKDKAIAALRKLHFNSLIRKIDQHTPEESFTEDKEFLKTLESRPKPDYIAHDIKGLMLGDEEAADKILKGASFWDLGQAEFLLNPLEHHDPKLSIPEEEYNKQLAEFGHYPKLYEVLINFDLPLIPVLYKMEKKGMLIDREYFVKLQSEFNAEIKRIEYDIYTIVGDTFNLNSQPQLSDVLFKVLKLPTDGIKKVRNGYSTGAKELDKLRDKHPIIKLIEEYREASKLLSTYIMPILDLADEENRIHTTFTQNVTATGRLSSRDPNLQNIPVRTEEGKRIRTGFIAPKGRVLVSADYSQFELRLAAIMGGDKKLVEDFNSGIDIHTKTASDVFGVPMDKVTENERRAAKVINFGILYGMSIKGLSDATKMSVAEAKKFIDDYFKLRAPIKNTIAKVLEEARDKAYVETFFGRRRPTPDLNSTSFIVRQAAERAATNMPIQGTEADLMKRAMIRVDAKLPKGADLIMQVHDSLMVECDENQKDEVVKILKETMESVAPELDIKLAVEITSGTNWGEL